MKKFKIWYIPESMYISKTLFMFLTDDEIFHSSFGNKIVDIIKLNENP